MLITIKNSRTRALLPALLAALCLMLPASAFAISVPAGFTLGVQIDSGGNTWTANQDDLSTLLSLSQSGLETTLALTGPQTVLGGAATIQDWDSTFDPDPFVTNNFVVINNSAFTQTYSITVNSPVAPTLLSGQIVQSNIILTLNDDDNAGGASVASVVGTPVYEAFVNGVSELSFLDDPFANSCASPFDCISNGISVAGVPSQAFGPVAATSIGISINFELSPGDSAAVQSRFEIVPEPATAFLLVSGLAWVGIAQRRRTHS